MNAPPTAPARPSRADRWGPWLAAALTLGPLVWCARSFAELWWFGDDWDLLDEIAHRNFWHWTFQPFAESFVPLFKVLWSGLVFAGGGSYFPMIGALWVTHALNVFLFARLLRRTGFGHASTALAASVFALTAANLETLAWSVQWSAILATTFLLGAVDWHARQRPEISTWSWRTQVVLAVLVAASALSFARGVLTGIVLALVSLLPIDEPLGRWGPRLRTAAVCLAPAVVVIVLIFLFAPGNHHRLGAQWIGPAVKFGSWYWSASPLHRLIEADSWGGRTTLVLAILKVTAIVGGLRCTHGPQRRLLVLLLVFDLANAALLGLGRYDLTIVTANSSRYQYLALLCTLPFVGCCFEALLQRLPSRGWRAAVATTCVALAALKVAWPWPREVEVWAGWRGRNTREQLLRNPHPPATGAVSGNSRLSTHHAKELIAHFHLH